MVDCVEEEFLKLTFGVLTVPQIFFFKDGYVYEMQTLSIFYDNIWRFVEEEQYLNETVRYQKFATPSYVVDIYTLYFVYAYNDGLRFYNSNQFDMWEFLHGYGITQNDYVASFFKLDIKTQYHIVLVLIVVKFWILVYLLRLLCRCVCARKIKVEDKPK